jgi:sugar/nucleoside kinase (ribokinase family)
LLNASLSACNGTTSVTVGFIHSCGERTFFTTRGHLEALAYEHVRPSLQPTPKAGSIAMLCGAFLTPALRKSYPRLIGEIVELGYEVALDTGWPPDGWTDASRAEVAGWLKQCDHVLLNELEVVNLADRPDLDAATAQVALMLKPGATLVVKTGERGALGIQQGSGSSSGPRSYPCSTRSALAIPLTPATCSRVLSAAISPHRLRRAVRPRVRSSPVSRAGRSGR